MASPTDQPRSHDFVLTGFVTLTDWSILQSALDHRLGARPCPPLTIECRRVTGFAPEALMALGAFVKSEPDRLRLRNWPAATAEAVLRQHLLERVIDCAGAAATAAARAVREGTLAEDELRGAEARMGAAIARLKRTWAAGRPAQVRIGRRGDPSTN